MATYSDGRRIKRQTSQIVLNLPAVGVGANGSPYSGAQVTLSLPTALYGILVPMYKSNTTQQASRFGLQTYNRTLAAYNTNQLSSDSLSPFTENGTGLSPLLFRPLPPTIATPLDWIFRQRLTPLDAGMTWYDADANNGYMAGMIGLLVYHNERVQIGNSLSNIIPQAAVDYYFDLYEVY